jgi:hypothetical protein
MHLTTLKEQQSELEANVVKSPDRVKSEIVSLKENHHHLLQDNSKARERIRGKKESIEFMEDMAQMLEKLNAKLDEKKRRQEDIKLVLCRQTDKQICRRKDRQTCRQTSRQTNKQTSIYIDQIVETSL